MPYSTPLNSSDISEEEWPEAIKHSYDRDWLFCRGYVYYERTGPVFFKKEDRLAAQNEIHRSFEVIVPASFPDLSGIFTEGSKIIVQSACIPKNTKGEAFLLKSCHGLVLFSRPYDSYTHKLQFVFNETSQINESELLIKSLERAKYITDKIQQTTQRTPRVTFCSTDGHSFVSTTLSAYKLIDYVMKNKDDQSFVDYLVFPKSKNKPIKILGINGSFRIVMTTALVAKAIIAVRRCSETPLISIETEHQIQILEEFENLIARAYHAKFGLPSRDSSSSPTKSFSAFTSSFVGFFRDRFSSSKDLTACSFEQTSSPIRADLGIM